MSYIYTIIQTLYFSIGLAIINSIPWTFIFIFLKPYNITYYVLNKRDECKRIQKKIKYWSQQTDNGKGCGYSFGYNYLIHLHITDSEDEQYTLKMLTTNAIYENFIKDVELDQKNQNINEANKIEQSSIRIYDRLGSFHHFWYKKRTMKIPSIKPRINQKNILDQIIDHYNTNKHTVVYLHGTPGSGKSIMGFFIAEHYKCNYTNSFVPWHPGDTLSNLYSEVDPTEENPLILALEEIDIPLIRIHNNEIDSHKDLPIQIQNKTGWNKFFDAIDRSLFPYLIILMTSNKSVKFINELDQSYLRKGRVNLTFELNSDQ
jgi:hypothetical protein